MTDLTQLNKVLGFTTKDYLPKSRANPFVKWVGGKRSLIPDNNLQGHCQRAKTTYSVVKGT